jgi:hypothetical protein
MQPPKAVNPKTGEVNDIGAMIDQLSQAIECWRHQKLPKTDGQLRFNPTTMSSLTEKQMPLLRLPYLILDTKCIKVA